MIRMLEAQKKEHIEQQIQALIDEGYCILFANLAVSHEPSGRVYTCLVVTDNRHSVW